MAERIKLNKVSLREQKQKLALYQRFLPALEARKQQFLMQMAAVRTEMRQVEEALEARMADMALWAPLVRTWRGFCVPFWWFVRCGPFSTSGGFDDPPFPGGGFR
jgi:vacuolar-type H+-ATPase subunit D/Vma8